MRHAHSIARRMPPAFFGVTRPEPAAYLTRQCERSDARFSAV